MKDSIVKDIKIGHPLFSKGRKCPLLYSEMKKVVDYCLKYVLQTCLNEVLVTGERLGTLVKGSPVSNFPLETSGTST